ELAELSDALSGGDIKNITLKLCIKLSANTISILDNKIANDEIIKYRQSLAASQGGEFVEKLPTV
ncbi:MAG: hypothetical protein RIS64_1395, partial [Bacteroidota bacterium]